MQLPVLCIWFFCFLCRWRFWSPFSEIHQYWFRRPDPVPQAAPVESGTESSLLPFLQPACIRILFCRPKSAILINEKPKHNENCKTWQESHAFACKVVVIETGVHFVISWNVGHISSWVNCGVPKIKNKLCLIECVEAVGVCDGVDLALWVHVLSEVFGLVEHLVLPHVEVEKKHEEQHTVVEPLSCK